MQFDIILMSSPQAVVYAVSAQAILIQVSVITVKHNLDLQRKNTFQNVTSPVIVNSVVHLLSEFKFESHNS